MKKLLGASLFALCAAPLCLAESGALPAAGEHWLRGRYEEARAAYEELLKDAKTRPAAAVGLSRTFQSVGEYDKALAVVDDALKDAPRDAGLLARRAELLHLRGQWDEADKSVAAALELDKDHFLARWVRAMLYRDRGDVQKADAECRWFVRTYSQRSDADNDVKDPDHLLIVALAGAENARWHNLADQFQFILTEVYADALKQDKGIWLAEYGAGMLLLEKYNRNEALDAFDKALTINPAAAEALVGKGQAALMRLEIKDAEDFAERALKINPNLPEALRLRADVHLAAGNTEAAFKELAAARKIGPRDERTLARVAACLFLQTKNKDFEAVVEEVTKFDAKPALFYYELGERLEERKRWADAEKHFKKAAELRPRMPGPMNSLGMLYTRLGREKEAAELLDKGFAADPFNVRVSNMRKVLKHLGKYESLKTAHFELRFDPKLDKMLARFMGQQLEAIYSDLAGKFKYFPKGPILVEVFNTHEMFSGRTIALPDLHTIGACTGRMVAMVSPHGKGIRKPFNWGRVLRHEIVHIFNLEQTNFLVPHWLTEGLAVNNEGFPRPPIWNQLLRERVPSGELLNLDTVDLGFIRPRNALEWQMAYCQSQLYVDYLTKSHGPQAVAGMLDAYRDGLDTTAALNKVCGVEKAEFEKGYRTHLEETVKGMPGRPTEKKRTLAQLKEAHEKDAADLDTAAELAEALLERGRDRVEARKLAEAVRDKKKNHPRASYVLARLAQLAGDVKQERELLEGALDRDAPDPKVLLALGKIYYDASEPAKAAEVLELGRKAEPLENEWLHQLARVYAQTGDRAKQIEILTALAPTDADDFASRKKLARLLLDGGRNADAAKVARQALEIDLRDAEVRDMLLKALDNLGQRNEAAKLKELFGDRAE
jgi:tetratricopeptide (TPR) repeat protein